MSSRKIKTRVCLFVHAETSGVSKRNDVHNHCSVSAKFFPGIKKMTAHLCMGRYCYCGYLFFPDFPLLAYEKPKNQDGL
jgi:hypothetical protein